MEICGELCNGYWKVFCEKLTKSIHEIPIYANFKKKKRTETYGTYRTQQVRKGWNSDTIAIVAMIRFEWYRRNKYMVKWSFLWFTDSAPFYHSAVWRRPIWPLVYNRNTSHKHLKKEWYFFNEVCRQISAASRWEMSLNWHRAFILFLSTIFYTVGIKKV